MKKKDETRGAMPITRKEFFQRTGGVGAALVLLHLERCAPPAGRIPEQTYGSWKDIYRNKWEWDSVTWGSHSNQCFPGGCNFRVYTKDNIVWREEQAANTEAVGPDYPDFNPQGCQKGCGFHNLLYAPERLKYPLKRAGKRGEGKWKRVSWDEAMEDIADAILDAHRDYGPETVVLDAPHVHGGVVAWAGGYRLNYLLGGVATDTNANIGDFFAGMFQTFGKAHTGYTADNLMDSELIVVSMHNPSYTSTPTYHFFTEARYNGAEVVLLAPDYNASSIMADIHVPVKTATDGAFWLGVCQVMISEKLFQADFVREQTDLALLVRRDNGRYLRATEMEGGPEARHDQLYFFDQRREQVVRAPRGTLAFDGEQALAGEFDVRLKSGDTIKVAPAFQLLSEKLDREYTPEQAGEICGVHGDLIRELARKIAKKRTCFMMGWSSPKHYHGDLMERSQLLALALSGNWGKPGTGWNNFLMPLDFMELVILMESTSLRGGAVPLLTMMAKVGQEVKKEDPEASDEIVKIITMERITRMAGFVPPVFWMYNHLGYDKLWDRKEWGDPNLKRSFGDYLKESLKRGYYKDWHNKPAPDKPPQVVHFLAHNPLRRGRSAHRQYLDVLFPKTKMVFTIDTRMSATAMYSDIVLPAAWYYEKHDITSTIMQNPYQCRIEKAVEPPGQAKEEWQIYALLAAKITERAQARGMKTYPNILGETKKYADVYKRFTMNESLLNSKDVVDEMTLAGIATGTFPLSAHRKFKKEGQVRFKGFGITLQGEAAANEMRDDRPFFSFRWHVEDKKIFPTYARRAQFYIEHEWFLEAGEALPVYKDTPNIGGKHGFRLVSAHNRHSVHSLHQTNEFFLRMHRGQPTLFIGTDDARKKRIKDGDQVAIYNDFDEAEFMAVVSSAVAPGLLVTYMWDSYQFKKWRSHDALLVGLPKAIHLAGDYGQLRYFIFNGSPMPVTDRALRVGLRRVR